MSRVLSYAVIVLLAAAAVFYFTVGPNVLFGGPSKSAIIAAARQAAVESATTEADKKLAAEVSFSPRGICNTDPSGGYACIVDSTAPGFPTTAMVVIVRKEPNGEWVPVN